jgi:hypothetical protein
MGLIWLTLTFTNNGYGAAEDIFKGKAKRFDQLMSERYITLEKAKSSPEQNIYLRTIDDRPNTLFVIDISNNPNHWINTAYSMFFEITDKAIKPKDSN